MTLAPDINAILATYRWLAHAEFGVSEVRVIRPGRGGIVGIGLFDDEDAFVDVCAKYNDDNNIYVGIQPRPRGMLVLAPNKLNAMRTGAKADDIEIVTATVHDLDPVREKDTASTSAELAATLVAADTAADAWLADGLARPQRMISGNGYQLWGATAPIHLTNDNRHVVQNNLKALEARVRAKAGSTSVQVDSIHDLARIIKVIGTVSRKGTPSLERPHRLSVAVDGMDRVEDGALAARLLEPPKVVVDPSRTKHKLVVLPSRPSTSGAGHGAGAPSQDGASLDEMCSPIRKLWEQGYSQDRSLGLWDMTLWFVHKGLTLEEITPLILEFDQRTGNKLAGRDPAAYVRHCHERIELSRGSDGAIAPPCHSLQHKLEYCRVNRDPGVRCELYESAFDIDKAIAAVPPNLGIEALERAIYPILETIASRSHVVRRKYLDLIAKAFGLKVSDLRRTIKQIEDRHQDETEERVASANASASSTSAGPTATASSAPAGANQIVGEIFEDVDHYFRVRDEENEILSSFVLVANARLLTEDGEMIVCEARTDKGAMIPDIALPLHAFHSRKDFLRHLPSADLQWTGDDANTQGVMRALARRKVPRQPGTKMLGAYERDGQSCWVCEKGAITASGFVDPSPVTYVPSDGPLDGKVRYPIVDDATFRDVAHKVFDLLPKANTPRVMVPIIGWFAASPVKPRFMLVVRSFPLLAVHGPAGSGKSSLLCDVMWPLVGIADGEAFSATETDFAMIRALTSTKSIPIVIDEYKPFDMPRERLRALHRLMRRLYRGEAERRGRADQGLNKYPLQAPLCVAGETRPTEAAILERIITAAPEKKTLSEMPECRSAFNALKALDLSVFAARYIQFCLGRDFDADLAAAQRLSDLHLTARTIPLRVRQNITAMLMGIHLFTEFAVHCGYKDTVDLDIAAGITAVIDDLLEADNGGVKNPLDRFLEMLGVMAVQGELKYGKNYVFDDGLLFIHTETCYDLFRQHCKKIDYEGEIVDEKALSRLIHENQAQGGYVKDRRRVYFTPTDRRRGIGIDVSATSFISADDFPDGSRSHVEMDLAGFRRLVEENWRRREGARGREDS